MLLFQQKKDKQGESNKVFSILSQDQRVHDCVRQLLSRAGFSQFKHLHSTLEEMTSGTISSVTSGVIIDISGQENMELTLATVQSLIPRNVWCCVVGNSDSITLARRWAHNNILYFLLPDQEDDFVAAVINGETARVKRKASSITVLGCKGGVGTSTLAWRLAGQLGQQHSMPTLFIQDKSGSRDLPFRVDKKLSQIALTVDRNLDVLAWPSSGLPLLEEEAYSKYHYVIFDACANTLSKEELRALVEFSSCLVLVLDRSACALKQAHEIHEIVDSINRIQPVPHRLIFCLNDTRPVTMDMLSVDNIESVLGTPLSVAFRYQKHWGSPLGVSDGKGSAMSQLTSRVLGMSGERRQSVLRRLLKRGRG